MPRLTLACVAAALLTAASYGADAPRLEVGEPFPDLVLPALDDGRPLSVAQFRGRRLILMVFASW
jgi:hypothetical protein